MEFSVKNATPALTEPDGAQRQCRCPFCTLVPNDGGVLSHICTYRSGMTCHTQDSHRNRWPHDLFIAGSILYSKKKVCVIIWWAFWNASKRDTISDLPERCSSTTAQHRNTLWHSLTVRQFINAVNSCFVPGEGESYLFDSASDYMAIREWRIGKKAIVAMSWYSASFVGTEVRSMRTARVSARIRNGDLPSASPYADYVDVSVVCRVRNSASLFSFRPVV